MNIEAIKIDLAQQLFSIDKIAVLDQIKRILEKESIVSYSANGKPLTLSKYNKELEEAEQDIKAGRTISSEELTKNIESWRK